MEPEPLAPAPEDDTARSASHPPHIPHSEPAAGTASIEAAAARGASPLRRFLKLLGPGLITGASDDDPSGIGTYATAGAALGYATLWTALATYPLMAVTQYICAKIGMVSGMGLSGVLRRHYSRQLLYASVVVLTIANTINAGTDIGAIAAGVNLLVPVKPALLIIPIALGIVAFQVWGSYRLIARIFKWLALALLAYVGAAFFAHPDARQVLRATFVPTLHLDAAYLATLVAILGTTISPYLFFWQASQEVEEEVSLGRRTLKQRKGATDGELRWAAWDVWIGMLFSNLVFYFIILATAATLHQAGKTDVQSAADAAAALRPLVGGGATFLFAVGIIGSGILAVPILTGASAYAVAEAFGWEYGLEKKPRRARRFYAIIVASTGVGLLINFLGINPIKALFWTAVLNGFLAPPLLVVVLRIANNRKVMGKRVNGPWANAFGWLTALVMTAAAVALVWTWVKR